jgi:hypothetical protein
LAINLSVPGDLRPVRRREEAAAKAVTMEPVGAGFSMAPNRMSFPTRRTFLQTAIAAAAWDAAIEEYEKKKRER